MGFRPAALAACMTTCGEEERRDEHLHAWPGGLGGLHDHLVLRQSSLDGIAPSCNHAPSQRHSKWHTEDNHKVL